MPTDEDLKTASTLFARTRDEGAPVDGLIEQYLPRLRAFVRARVGPELRLKESASDLVQSVCRELIAGQDKFEFRGEPEFRSWLFASALNKIRQRKRFYQQQKRDADREVRVGTHDEALLFQGYATVCTPSHVASAQEQIAVLEASLDHLAEDHRQVVGYVRFAGLSIPETAVAMNRSEGAVRQLLGRALLKLAEELRKAGVSVPGEGS